MISFDAGGAFDAASHHGPVEVLRRVGADTYTRRLLRRWAEGRSFIVNRQAPQGDFFGGSTPMFSGLPQGGVLSPPLWLLFFVLPRELATMRRDAGDEPSAFTDLVFPGDVTTVITAPTARLLQNRAESNVANVRQRMSDREVRAPRPAMCCITLGSLLGASAVAPLLCPTGRRGRFCV